VILEFAVNDKADAEFNSPPRRAYEQLVRKLLQLPSKPAVVLLHHYAWWMSSGDGKQQGLFYSEPEGQYTVLAHVRVPSFFTAPMLHAAFVWLQPLL